MDIKKENADIKENNILNIDPIVLSILLIDRTTKVESQIAQLEKENITIIHKINTIKLIVFFIILLPFK